ncbi:hypothetical protein ASPCAL12798 [Aspergillus calidoustus]|uniref:Zn(2)-C6 fungal-type domain-containing protein n=1 Tax=Aspergillus calidoustus TaxID=454130 RepID=A0A0U5GBR5_ASPCI|nr:hypothetical protein ASPCAL12798 [Aspergillus calidoustus]
MATAADGTTLASPSQTATGSLVDTTDLAPARHPGLIRTRPGQGRKSKACHECKKLKIRCELPSGSRKCRYCQRRDLDCVVNHTVTTQVHDGELRGSLASSEESQKIDALRQEIQAMKASLDALLARCPLQQGQVSALQALGQHQEADALAKSVALPSADDDNTQMAMTRENSLEPTMNSDGNEPVTLEEPMGSLYEVTRLRNIRSNKAKTARPSPGTNGELKDFISRGVIAAAEAEELYRVFHNTLNHYLWVGLEQIHSSFNSVRQSSELLAATILTVTALHIPTSAATFDACYKEFLALISSSMFSRYHSIDDVRGLCIAAFWLSEVSWKLSGHAIRIATELNLHQSFSRALQGDREHFLRARLWYMLYVCDHHFSIAYGRPPMVSESIQIREHELFLASPLSDILDARILSQVNLMQILTRVYDRFSERRLPDLMYVRSGGNVGSSGADFGHGAQGRNGDANAAMLSEADLEELRSYNLEIDQWRMRWYPRQPPNPFIGSFPHRGIVLYTYFAKLQINSLSVRGISVLSGRLSADRKEIANMAVSSAVNILTMLVDEEDMRRSLVGTPLYVHTIIAVASAFLLKVATKWNRLMALNIEYAFVSRLIEKMVDLLKNAVTSERHLLKHIARGLEEMLNRLKSRSDAELLASQARPVGPLSGWQRGSSTTQATPRLQDVPESRPISLEALPPNSHVGGMQEMGTMPYLYPFHVEGQENVPLVSEESALMNDALLWQAFDTDPTNDVYNLLSTQFHP